MVIVESLTIPFHVPIAGLVGLELVGFPHPMTINRPIRELKRTVLIKTLMKKILPYKMTSICELSFHTGAGPRPYSLIGLHGFEFS
jgi:hypothetical protein